MQADESQFSFVPAIRVESTLISMFRLRRVYHCEKFRTLISNSWAILQTSVTFPAHASIEMYGIKFIFEYHKLLLKFERSPMMDNMISYHSARLMEFSATAARFLIRISTPP